MTTATTGILDGLAILLPGVVAVAAGGFVTGVVFRLVDRGHEPQGEPSAPAQRLDDAEESVVAAASVLRGGAWIGVLERLAIFASIVAGWPEGIAVTLAVKGLGRYPELKTTTSAAGERFIIGTFVSVLWACLLAGAALWLRRAG